MIKKHKRFVFVLVIFLIILAYACQNCPETTFDVAELDFKIPEIFDWTDHGIIFTAGDSGTWDHLLYGGFAGTSIKKEGVYYLYYQGAYDYDEKYGTVRYRSIGLATSSDGITFEKYIRNPILEWSPKGFLEEGAVSNAVILDSAKNFLMFYGANTAVDEWQINADTRLAFSENGLEFTDQGIVLNHRDKNVWGWGDELFAVNAIYFMGNYYVYYIINGTMYDEHVGVSWGDKPDKLSKNGRVHENCKAVKAWGMAGNAQVGENLFLLFMSNVRKSQMEVRIVDLNYPDRVSAALRTYRFDNFSEGTTIMDEEQSRWLMYYRTSDSNGYGVKSAPLVRSN